MTISVIETHASRTGIFPTLLAGVQDGDLILVTIANDSAPDTYNPPSGFSLLGEHEHSLASLDQAVYVKTASSESGSYTFQGPANNNMPATLVVIRGSEGDLSASAFTPLEANASTATTNTVDASSGDMVIASFSNDGAVTVATPPSGMTLEASMSADSSITVTYSEVLASDDATYDATVTWSVTEQAIASAILITEASSTPTLDSADNDNDVDVDQIFTLQTTNYPTSEPTEWYAWYRGEPIDKIAWNGGQPQVRIPASLGLTVDATGDLVITWKPA